MELFSLFLNRSLGTHVQEATGKAVSSNWRKYFNAP